MIGGSTDTRWPAYHALNAWRNSEHAASLSNSEVSQVNFAFTLNGSMGIFPSYKQSDGSWSSAGTFFTGVPFYAQLVWIYQSAPEIINTDSKFTVVPATGDTEIKGTLSVGGASLFASPFGIPTTDTDPSSAVGSFLGQMIVDTVNSKLWIYTGNGGTNGWRYMPLS